MADIKKVKSDAIATIDAAMTILDRLPEFDEANVSLSYNESFNPFQFLMDLFKSTVGYDTFLNIISKIIATGLPAIEIAVKTILLTNFRNLISCTLNPIISRDVILNGFVFNLYEIDLLNILQYSPLSYKIGVWKPNIGRNYYFGCDDFDKPYELKNAGDFNAFLYYVKNYSLGREVWRGVKLIQSTFDDSAWGDRKSYIYQRPMLSPEEMYDEKGKCVKRAGIITLEYNERNSSLTLADGSGSLSLKTPYNNCLHVFIGNTAPEQTEELTDLENILRVTEQRIEDLKNELISKKEKLDYYQAIVNEYKSKTEEAKLSAPELGAFCMKYQLEIDKLKRKISEIEQDIASSNVDKINAESELNALLHSMTKTNYRSVEKNYYFNRTIMEFNTDYITSLKLFDSKVVITQLIDALTNCLSIDLNLSYEQIFVKNEIKKMVSMINETDDIVVNDCFFSFSNEEYENMIQKTELTRAGLLSENGELNSAVKVDAEKILSNLNTINENTSKEEMTTIINGALTEISKSISNTEYELKDNVNFNVQMNFIENLLTNLAFVITSAVISPKLYLLLGINLQMLGSETNFDLAAFVEMHKQMIVSIIRSIRDKLISLLVEFLQKIVGRLAEEIGKKIAVEQIFYYKELIKRCVECFKMWGKSKYMDFDVDNIDYADILQEESEEPNNNNC